MTTSNNNAFSFVQGLPNSGRLEKTPNILVMTLKKFNKKLVLNNSEVAKVLMTPLTTDRTSTKNILFEVISWSWKVTGLYGEITADTEESAREQHKIAAKVESLKIDVEKEQTKKTIEQLTAKLEKLSRLSTIETTKQTIKDLQNSLKRKNKTPLTQAGLFEKIGADYWELKDQGFVADDSRFQVTINDN